MSENVPNQGRREFLKKSAVMIGIGAGLVSAAAMAKKVSGNYDASVEVPKPNSEIGLLPDKLEGLYSGEVKKDESLTTAIERISGKKMDPLSSMEVVWKNGGVDYIIKNKQAFLYLGEVPLPYAQPGDEIIFGNEDDMHDKLIQPGVLTNKERVIIGSGNKKTDDIIETNLTVSGGRFDLNVFYKLKNDRSGWEVNPEGNRWVDSHIFKKLMDDNPDMKSSEAFELL
jgi:hypothetical protein